MAVTIIGLNDPKAVKKYSGMLAVDVPRLSYWGRKFMGSGEGSSAPIYRLTQLESDSGEQITYDLSMALRMQPVEGDNILENREEDLRFYTDNVYIDQMRGGVNTGGRMTRKRTLHDLRKVARKRQSEWWARVFDELFFIYLSGTRGQSHTDYIFPTSYAGFANNTLTAPDTSHQMYANLPNPTTHSGAGSLTSTVNAVPKVTDIEYIAAYLEALGGGSSGIPKMQPINVEGEETYVALISPWGAYAMRTQASTGQWLDIQKSIATREGKASPILRGGLGMINNIVLHEHQGVIQWAIGGAHDISATVFGNNCARGLILGQQAGVCAFGSPGNGLRFDWNEETRDNGNQVVITTNAIFGIKKCTFNSLDFGVIAYDYYDPRP